MAVVEGDTFEIPLSIDNKVTKIVDSIVLKLQSSIEKIPKSINLKNIENELSNVSKKMSSLGGAVSEVNKTFQNNSKILEEASENASNFNTHLSDNSKALKLNSTGFSRVTSSIVKYASFIESSTILTNSFGRSLLNAITPKTLNRLENLLSILAAIAKFKGLDTLADNLLKAQRKVEDLENAVTSFADSAEQDFEDAARSADAFNGRLGILGVTIQKIGDTASDFASGFISGFSKIFNIFNKINDALADITLISRSLFDAFKNLTDPAFVNNLANILAILSAVFRLKGQKQLADFFEDSAERVDKLSDTLQVMRSEGGFSLDEISEKAKLLNIGIKTLEFSVDSLKVAFFGFLALKLGSRIDFVRNSFSKLDTGIQALFARSKLLGGFLNSKFNPGLLKLTEIATIIGPLMFGLGKALSESESQLVSFIGKITLAASLIAGSFAAALTLGLKLFSDWSISLGDKLINTMNSFTSSANKAESSLSAFQFTVEGFNNVVGESVGTLEFWEEQIRQIASASTFGTNEIRKGISLLIKEGAALGLDSVQNAKLAKVAMDLAASTGKDFEDVTLRIVNGLTGQSQGLLAIGINIRESALAHSEFVKGQHDLVSSMSDAQKQTLRFNEIIKQSRPLLGAAKFETETVAGVNKIYERTLEDIKVRLGETNEATKAYQKSLTNLAQLFLNLPGPLVEITGTLIDFAGVTLKVIGTLTKYILTIGLVVSAISIMNTLLGTSITLQSTLGLVFGTVATKVGVQAIAITGLNSVLLQLALITKGAVTIALKSLISTLLALGKTIAVVTLRILKNPLFIKAALIGSAIFIVIKAVKELFKELSFLSDMFETSSTKMTLFSTIVGTLKTGLIGIFRVFVDLSKFILSGLVGSVLLAIRAWTSFKALMAGNSEEGLRLQKEIEKIDSNLQELDSVIKGSQKSFTRLWGNSTAQAKDFAEAIPFEEMGKKASESIKIISESLKTINIDDIRIGVLGDEFDKAAQRIVSSRAVYDTAFNGLISGSEASKENIDKLKSAFKELTQANIEFESLRLDTFKQIAQQSRNLQIELLRGSGQEIEAIKKSSEFRLKEFDERAAKIKETFNLTIGDELRLAQVRASIVAKSEQEIAKIRDKARKEEFRKAKEAAQKRIDFISGVSKESTDLDIQRLQASKQFISAQQIINDQSLKAFDARIAKQVQEQKALDSNFKLRKEELDIIKKTRDALLEKNEAELEKAVGKEQEAAQKAAGPDAPQLFGPDQVNLIKSAFGDAAGSLAGAASSMMSPISGMMAAAQMSVGAIQQLIDFGPQFLDSVANIFNSLTDLPLKLAESFTGVLDSVLNLITNFPANIIKAIFGIFESIIDFFFEGLPKAIEQLPVLLMDAFFGFLDRLPSLFAKIGAGLPRLFITAGIRFITTLIKEIPRFVVEFVKAIPLMAEEFVNALVLGLKEAANAIANLFGFDDIFELPDIEEKMQDMGDAISRSASQLFEVVDLEAASRGLDVADRIRGAISGALAKAPSIFDRIGRKLSELFKSIGRKIAETFKAVGRKVSEIAKEIGKKLSETTKAIGKKVSETAKAIGEKVSETTKAVGAKISETSKAVGKKLSETTKAVGASISDFTKEFGSKVSDVAKSFGLTISNTFKNIGGTLSETFKNVILQPIKDIFKDIEIPVPEFLKNLKIEVPPAFDKFANAVSRLLSWSPPGFNLGGLAASYTDKVKKVGSVVSDKAKGVGGKIASAFADGGYVGNSGRIDVPSGKVNDGILYAQSGAFAQGTDTIDAKLTPGEFVVNREATRNNLGLLSFINATRDPVSPVEGTQNFSIVVNAKTMLTAEQIRREVIPEMEKQLRRKSQQGKFVLSQAGIRT